jgi:Flp pilus assembly protein TadD/ADP-heptose:LPS heptosyltransferase
MNINKIVQSAFALHKAGHLEQAEALCKKILKKQAKNFDALHMLGVIHYQRKWYESSTEYLQQAVDLCPNNAEAYSNLGNTLFSRGDRDEALRCYKKALHINPFYPEAYNNLGILFSKEGCFDEAMQCYGKAIELKPVYADAYINFGTTLLDKAQIRESLTYFQKAIQLDPQNALAHFHMAFVFLLTGKFKEGWREYEWRWQLEEFEKRPFSKPRWNGFDLRGRTILLYKEQGVGDTLQFIRYAPLVAELGARVVVEVQPQLVTLIQGVEGIDHVVGEGEPVPAFDFQCPFMSLPLVFNTVLENIPANIPYISADAALIHEWADKIGNDKNESKLKVGLVWSGGKQHKRDRYRSCSLDAFAPLGEMANVVFYSLQKGKAGHQAKNPPPGMSLIDHMDAVEDFADTAALIENLDMVISVDTAVAHLAGALGKPVWLLIPIFPDFRWMLERDDSPWYPTMRLFRQKSMGDWGSVIEDMRKELKIHAETYSKAMDSQEEDLKHDGGLYPENEKMNDQAGKWSDNAMRDQTNEKTDKRDPVAVILQCEGVGDCLFAMAVMKKLHVMNRKRYNFILFTRQPDLFEKYPYVKKVYSLSDGMELQKYDKKILLFDTSKLPYHSVDVFDFISIPLGIGELSFREKQLEYFPKEKDDAQYFDVVLNTSVTWPGSSWPLENWQKIADFLLSSGCTVAVVGRDSYSEQDNMWKRSSGLAGCTDLTNTLSLDQTYYAIKKCGLFITCHNSLSVLSGSTDTEVIILDMSIEWSKRAIYRSENPHHKVTYVKGNCTLYCCRTLECSVYGEFRCIPTVEKVIRVIEGKLKLVRGD